MVSTPPLNELNYNSGLLDEKYSKQFKLLKQLVLDSPVENIVIDNNGLDFNLTNIQLKLYRPPTEGDTRNIAIVGYGHSRFSGPVGIFQTGSGFQMDRSLYFLGVACKEGIWRGTTYRGYSTNMTTGNTIFSGNPHYIELSDNITKIQLHQTNYVPFPVGTTIDLYGIEEVSVDI